MIEVLRFDEFKNSHKGAEGQIKGNIVPNNIYVVYFEIKKLNVSNICKSLGAIFHLHWWKSTLNSIDVIGSTVA